MNAIIATLFLTLRGCGGASPDDTATCAATLDPEGTVPVTFKTWDPADPCGTFVTVTEEHDAAYWGDWWVQIECQGIAAEDVHYFTDASGRCIFFYHSAGWDAFDDPWLIRLEAGHPCFDHPTCP